MRLKTFFTMALPIDIEDLLKKCKVESDRIEFKKGWNPISIYHTICAFANDFDNIGGGYILVGVEEENGIAKRPITGIPTEQLDAIQKQILQYNQLIEPFYAPRLSIEEVDGLNILVIWVTSGNNRPYAAPQDVTAKLKKPVYYIRYGSSSIEAKGEMLDQLRDMASRIPFDDRGNEEIKLKDISPLLLKDYLVKVGSRLAQTEELTDHLDEVLEQMELFDGPKEKRLIKNVAAMMFCEHPERFFKTTQVDIVVFPEGRENNPDNMIEAPAIKGSVPIMIQEALGYLRTNIIKKRIQKIPNDEKAVTCYNYPYAALEEAVVNALYHRDYREREPVEICIEPHRISILSYSGPDRTISMDAIKEATTLRARRYRNRRLGEFLKELGLTEGRATGIPTIQRKLAENGSARATIETDNDRSYFLIDIPCHPSFLSWGEGFKVNEAIESVDIKAFAERISKSFPSHFQVISKLDFERLAVCLARCASATSAKQILNGIEGLSNKQLRNKYLQPLLDMELIEMTIPDKPRSQNQKYVLTEKGKEILS